jgi:hypothetical protein
VALEHVEQDTAQLKQLTPTRNWDMVQADGEDDGVRDTAGVMDGVLEDDWARKEGVGLPEGSGWAKDEEDGDTWELALE